CLSHSPPVLRISSIKDSNDKARVPASFRITQNASVRYNKTEAFCTDEKPNFPRTVFAPRGAAVAASRQRRVRAGRLEGDRRRVDRAARRAYGAAPSRESLADRRANTTGGQDDGAGRLLRSRAEAFYG